MTLYFHLGFFPLFFLIASYHRLFSRIPPNRWNSSCKGYKRIRSIHLSRYILLKDLETSIYVSITKWKRIRGEINKRFPIFRSKIFISPLINSIFLPFRIKNCKKEFLYEKYYISLYIAITNHCIQVAFIRKSKMKLFFIWKIWKETRNLAIKPTSGKKFYILFVEIRVSIT